MGRSDSRAQRAGIIPCLSSQNFIRLRKCMSSEHFGRLAWQFKRTFDPGQASRPRQRTTVVKVTSYLTDMKNRVAYGQCLGRNFGTAPLPVHTLIGVASLAFPEMMVETDVTAITPD